MRLPRAFFVYLLFASLGFLILLTNIKIPSRTYLAWRNFSLYLIAPALWSAEEFAKDQLNLPANIVEIINARKENVFLKRKILEYEKELVSYRALIDENEFLRKSQRAYLSGLRTNYYLVAAEVVLRDPASWTLGCMINAGRRHGITKNSAVVVPLSFNFKDDIDGSARLPEYEDKNVMSQSDDEKAVAVSSPSYYPMGYERRLKKGGIGEDRFVLVGKISEVLDDVSEVMFVTNPMFAVPAIIPSTGCEGLLEYLTSDTLILNYPSKASAPIGAEVVVSDSSRIFPARLYIGDVISNDRLKGGIKVSPAFLRLPLSNFVILVKK